MYKKKRQIGKRTIISHTKNMLYTLILIVFLATSPTLISSLNCYYCQEVIVVNYTITSDRVPSFSNCTVIEAQQCSISLTWNIHNDTSAIVVGDRHAEAKYNASQDMAMGIVFMDIAPNKVTVLLAHNLFFSCTTADKCNDEDGLKKMIRSLTIEDQFRQELASLISIASSFDGRTAGCSDSHSGPGYCPASVLTACQRCVITVDQILTLDKQICASCPQYSLNTNAIMRQTTFLLNDRSVFSEHVQIDCQQRGCNSMDNINRVYRARKIAFNFDEYYKKN